MPAENARREHHGRWRQRAERRAANRSRDRSTYGPDSRRRERTGMLSRRVTEGGIRIGPVPSKDRSTVDHQIAGTNQPTAEPVAHIAGRESRHSVRSRAMSSKDASLYVRGAPPGRRRAPTIRQTHSQAAQSQQMHVLTRVRASICKAGPNRACAL
jgi:hypothetical protein